MKNGGSIPLHLGKQSLELAWEVIFASNGLGKFAKLPNEQFRHKKSLNEFQPRHSIPLKTA